MIHDEMNAEDEYRHHVDGQRKKEEEEEAVVPPSDAVVHPWTVVVKGLNKCK